MLFHVFASSQLNFLFLSSTAAPALRSKKHTDITTVQDVLLDHDTHSHHKFESGLVSFEESSVDIAVSFVSQRVNDVLNSIFGKLSFGRVVNTIVEDVKELTQ